MCNFFSAIVTKSAVLWDKDLDSHTALLEKFGINDKSHKPAFVRVELTPKDGDLWNHNLLNWTLNVDQEYLPDWFDEREAERATRKELEKAIKTLFVTEGYHVLKQGRLFLGGTASAILYGSASAVLCDSSSAELYNSSSAELYNSASAILYGSASAVLCDSSSAELYNSSSAELYNSASAVLHNSSSAEAHNESNVIQYGGEVVLKDKAQKIDRR